MLNHRLRRCCCCCLLNNTFKIVLLFDFQDFSENHKRTTKNMIKWSVKNDLVCALHLKTCGMAKRHVYVCMTCM